MSNGGKLLVTGASGNLGRRVVEILLEKERDRGIIATTRKPEKLTEKLGAKIAGANGRLEIRTASFDDPTALAAAFEGASRLLLISTDKIGKRVQQHKNAVDAAKKAGVQHIIYTSLQGADCSPSVAAPEHVETERYIQQSGLSFTILRNSLYADNLLMKIPSAIQSGKLMGAAGTGKIAYVTRADCARAAAAALLSNETGNRTLDITGPKALSYEELAAIASRISGKSVSYVDQSPEEFQQTLIQSGLPAAWAPAIISFDVAAKEGTLERVSGAFQEMTGQAPKDVEEFLHEHPAPGR